MRGTGVCGLGSYLARVCPTPRQALEGYCTLKIGGRIQVFVTAAEERGPAMPRRRRVMMVRGLVDNCWRGLGPSWPLEQETWRRTLLAQSTWLPAY